MSVATYAYSFFSFFSATPIETLWNMFGRNPAVGAIVKHTSIFIGALIGVTITNLVNIIFVFFWGGYAFGEYLKSLLYAWLNSEVWLGLNFNAFDLLIMNLYFALAFFFAYQILKLYYWFTYHTYAIIPELAKIHYSRKDVLIHVSEPLPFTEATISTDFSYDLPEKPKGVFQVFWKVDDQYFHNGHGFVADNRMYITAHQLANHIKLEDSTIYITSANNPTIFCKATPVDPDEGLLSMGFDFCEIKSKGAAAVLQLKSLKWRRYRRNSSVTVLHFDPFKMSYVQQWVHPKPMEKGELSFEILHKSNTARGDSGLPLLQDGDVVGIHVGFKNGPDGKPSYNRAQIPFPVIPHVYERGRQFSRIIEQKLNELAESVPNGSYSSTDEEMRYQQYLEEQLEKDLEEDEYYQNLYKDNQKLAEEYKEKRRNGLDVDQQGYRKEKTNDYRKAKEAEEAEHKMSRSNQAYAEEFKGMSQREINVKLRKDNAVLKNMRWADVEMPSSNPEEDQPKKVKFELPVTETSLEKVDEQQPTPITQDLKVDRSESRTKKTAEPGTGLSKPLTSNSKELNPELLQEVTQLAELLHSKADQSKIHASLNKLKSLPSYKAASQKKQPNSKT